MKKLLAFLLTVSVVFSCMAGMTLVSFAETNAPDGEGTEASPYIISTAEQFNAIFGQENIATGYINGSKYYRIVNDIDLTELDEQYYPYNATYVGFNGTITGWDQTNNAPIQRTINFGTMVSDGSYKNGSDNKYFGALAGTTTGSTVSYLTLEGTINSTATYTGGLFGNIGKPTTVSNVVNKINVTGVSYVGGLVGYSATAGSKLENCVNDGAITATADHCGGLVGYLKTTDLIKCANLGKVYASNTSKTGYAGGLVGRLVNSAAKTDNTPYVIKECYNAGTVTSEKDYCAALVARLEVSAENSFEISDCFNVGILQDKTNTTPYTGIVVGRNYSTVSVSAKNIYSTFYTNYLTRGNSNPSSGSYVKLSYSNGYVKNDTAATASGDTPIKITSEQLSALTETENSGFTDSSVWVAYSAVECEYTYPQLVGNIYKEKVSIDNTVNNSVYAYAFVGDGAEGQTYLDADGSPVSVAGLKYAAIAGKAAEISGYTLECGIITSKDKSNVKDGKKHQAVRKTDLGQFGIVLYDIEPGTYYAIPYATYKDADNNETVLYGTVKEIVINE